MGASTADGQASQNAHRMFVKAASGSRPDAQQSFATPSATNGRVSEQYTGGCPVVNSNQQTRPSFATAGGCPVVGVNPGNQMPHSPNAPLPGQSKPLSTWRQNSTIPNAKTDNESEPSLSSSSAPSSSSNEPTWVYPSEQMFYNAMKRKGWAPLEDDMPAVVAIHNAVNERAWSEIRHWEAVNGDAEACGGPRLVKFRGRPKDFSPKARLLNLLGYKLPFDRHDWVVDRCGTEVRYVIDFYKGAPMPGMPTAMHLDVRPALDSPRALFERLRMQWKWMKSTRWQQE